MQLHVEANASGVTVTMPNGDEFGLRRDGKGGVEISSSPRNASYTRSEMAAVYRSARAQLYKAA